jgi:voltage-gated potassium channel Kch
MKFVAAFVGLALILAILWDAFETIILPRRVTRRFRLTSFFYRSLWIPWAGLAHLIVKKGAREKYLGLFGPLSLLLLLSVWAVNLILGYALLLWATNATLHSIGGPTTFWTYVYLSGVTFFTLGYGDVSPVSAFGKILTVIETANGFGLLAIVISYLPTLYQAFSRREVSISLLDARAGSPSSAVELLRRHSENGKLYELEQLLSEWEHWSAELLESHLSYPVLCYFRSQHDNQSWLRALTTVLDTCALVIVAVESGPVWQARMTFAIARHAVVDIAQVFRTAPRTAAECDSRLTATELARAQQILTQSGIELSTGADVEQRLRELRMMYEPYVDSLAAWLLMPLPPWILPPDAIDNWKTSAWGRLQ